MDELYQRYLADPGSVDMAWWNFFADYQAGAQQAPQAPAQQGPQAGQQAAQAVSPATPPAGTQPRADDGRGPAA
ncbi:MAG TPA: hypothetical protein VE343_00820, partial [Streptosporangiaceae bacterium]|nr:hypothetical protein [Streptosporangiaceae bacterium]